MVVDGVLDASATPVMDPFHVVKQAADALGFLRDFSIGGGFRPTGFGEPGGGPRTEGASRGDDGRFLTGAA